ncbi:MAG: RNA 2'-phosphotransferase [Sideroxyarcus sp.]|nr:RNA 2'-phosphotransferase [Sideroxyarcus sp.]
MSKGIEATSKFLSYVLRHKPETIGLELDLEGWAMVDQLVNLASKHGTALTRELLLEVVATSGKKRFALSQDGSRIRANHGHSIQVDLGLTPQTPPRILLHGTATRFETSIRAQGLVAGSRQYVHLSADRETAFQVGKRYGKPLLLEVEALAMCGSGYEFFMSANGIWLTRSVPAIYLHFPNAQECNSKVSPGDNKMNKLNAIVGRASNERSCFFMPNECMGKTRFELTLEQEKRFKVWLVAVTQRAAEMQEEQEKVNRPKMLERMLKISASRQLSDKEEWMLSRLKSPLPRPLPYYGEDGGGISFTFTPTKRGTYCRVTESITGEFIDLDDLGWG